MTDSGGLYLVVTPRGTKVWRWKYRFAGKEKKLTIGRYPATSLAEARIARDRAAIMLASGTDPSAEKKRARAAQALSAMNTFESLARAWHKQAATALAPRYAGQILDRLKENVFPSVGREPIAEITPPQILEVIRSIEDRGAKEMAHRVRMHISDVFVWAIASGICEQDPAAIIRKALRPTNPKLRPAIIKIAELKALLNKTEATSEVWQSTHLASRLLALTAVRPGVLRAAARSEFEGLDGDQPLWRIPASKMKLTRERKRDESFEFVVPLAHQAVEVVRAALAASPSPEWLFPSVTSWRKPINDSALSKYYRIAGYSGVHVPHGWRSSFSTIMNEHAAIEDRERDRAIIDLMLAHTPEGVEAAYNRAAYMPRRRELAQTWADMLMEDISPIQMLLERPRKR